MLEEETKKTAEKSPMRADRSSEPPPVLTQVTRRAMATEFQIILPDRWAHAVELAWETLEQLESIEQSLTIYRSDSELSQVNQSAAVKPVALAQPTFDLLQRAVNWSQRTAGAFDVTAGPLVEAWGFTTRSGRKPTSAEVETALEKVGYQNLVLDVGSRSVKFAKPGMSINLGAIGKGDALDRMAAVLRNQGITDFLIHGGNSSVIAAGDQSPGTDLGWAVGVAHPTKPKRRLAGIWLRDQALATSGSGKQFFHHRGKRFGHVIDPRTGYPAGQLLSLTVLMDSAADADACATGLFVLSDEEREGLLEEAQQANETWVPQLAMVRPGDRQDAVTMETFGEIEWVEELDEGQSVSH